MEEGKNNTFHTSIMVKEWLEFLKDKAIKTYVDGTLGAGGHAEAVLREHPEIECFVGIDQDPDALKISADKLLPWKDKLKLFQGNFERLKEILKKFSLQSTDVLFLDIPGVSSMQLDRPEKGFSFMKEGPLDMRMDPTLPLTAEEIINEWSQEKLGEIFREYGEVEKWRFFAYQIVLRRKEKRIVTTLDLSRIIEKASPRTHKKKETSEHLIFQALRIAINRELEVLQRGLVEGISLLNPQGILGVISFHSLEDRIVKNFFRDQASDKVSTRGLSGLFLEKKPTVISLTKKPKTPSLLEIEENPRSRSAKLRVVQKL